MINNSNHVFLKTLLDVPAKFSHFYLSGLEAGEKGNWGKYEYEITSDIDLQAENIFPLFDKLYILTHCGRVTQICVFNVVKLCTSASSP